MTATNLRQGLSATDGVGAIARDGRWARTISPSMLRATLVGIDTVLIISTAAVAFAARGWLPFADLLDDHRAVLIATVVSGLLWFGALAVGGAYSTRHLRAGATEYKRIITATLGAASVVGIGCYLVDYTYPRGIFVLWFTLGSALILLARFTRRQVMHRFHHRGYLRTPVLVAGSDQHVDSVARVLRREKWLGFEVVGAVTRDAGQPATTGGLPVLGTLDGLKETVDAHGIETVIFAEGSFDSSAEFRRLAWKLEEHSVHMIVVPTLTDVGAHRLEVRPMAGLPLVDVERPRAIAAGRWVKRAFDVVCAGILLLLASPVLALTALAIKLEDGGPVIYRQPRVGLKGEMFDCLKFRSMCVDAEAKLAQLQAQNQGAGVLFKMKDDPRITKVGKFTRRFSIDELPQLWNALRGDMSLVGPRPALPREVAQYDSDTMRRLDVRPGLTGLWQVSGRSNLSWEDTVRLDLYYVDNWSMVQDLMILAKTAKAVVGSDGAY